MRLSFLAIYFAFLVGCGLSGGGGSSQQAVTSNESLDWRDEVIYQAITDRFADGDVNNNWNVNRTALGRYQGGDYQGIIDKADYLASLGVTAIWISPIVKNVEEDAGVAGYHGYWQQDFLALNPHFGDMGTLKRMIQEMHRRGIKVIVDIVTNHIGQLFYYDINLDGSPGIAIYGSGSQPGSPVVRVTEYDPDYDSRGIQAQVGFQSLGAAPVVWINEPAISRVGPEPVDFQNPDWYHRKGRVVPDVNGNWPADQTLLGDFPGGLKDLATERQDVRDALVRVFGEWIMRLDIDGFRIDTVKHIEHSFWTDFCSRIREIAARKGKKNFFLFGEAFDGDDALLASYTQPNMLDSLFYFSQKYTAIDGVIKHNGPTSRIETLWGQKVAYGQAPHPGGIGVAPAKALINFIDNHDVARYLAFESDDRRLRLAIGFIACADGIPCLYYGTEQGFRGAGDPTNRERLWDSNYDRTASLFQFTQRIFAVRKQEVALRRGDTRIRWSTDRTNLEEDAGIFAFERTAGNETVLYVMNVNPQKTSRTGFGSASMQTAFSQGTILKDLLDSSFSATVGAAGFVSIDVPSLSQRILRPQ